MWDGVFFVQVALFVLYLGTSLAMFAVIGALWHHRREAIIGYMILFKGGVGVYHALATVVLLLWMSGRLYLANEMYVFGVLIVAQAFMSVPALLLSGFMVGSLTERPIKVIFGANQNGPPRNLEE